MRRTNTKEDEDFALDFLLSFYIAGENVLKDTNTKLIILNWVTCIMKVFLSSDLTFLWPVLHQRNQEYTVKLPADYEK